LRAYSGRDISQRDLAEGLAAHSPPGRHANGHVRFVDAGYFATPGSLRDTDDAGAPVVLDRDLPRFRDLDRRGEPTDGLRLTVPKKFARQVEEPGLPSWLHTADASRYDAALGFLVAEEGEGA
jgi:CRISPR-associated endonuclease/helicase Cas3